jgi:hypothetical protein
MNSWRAGKYELHACVRSLPDRREVNSTPIAEWRHCSGVDTVRQPQSPSTHPGGRDLTTSSNTGTALFEPEPPCTPILLTHLSVDIIDVLADGHPCRAE